MLLHFDKPLKGLEEEELDIKFWDNAVSSYDNEKFKESVFFVLKYINKNTIGKINLNKKINLEVRQGSALIKIKVTDIDFSINAYFIKLKKDANNIAILRKVSEVNFDDLMLSQIVLEDDVLVYKYNCNLNLCQPQKIYQIIREICLTADYFDDIFVNKYNAEFFLSPVKLELKKGEMEKVLSNLNNIYNDYDKAKEYFINKRLESYLWSLTAISLLKISNMPYVQGGLKNELFDVINYMYNSDYDFGDRIKRGQNFIEELKNRDITKIKKELYHAKNFFPLLRSATPSNLEEELDKYIELIRKYRDDKNHLALYYYLQVSFQKLIYDFNINVNLRKRIYKVLGSLNKQDIEKSSYRLLKLFEEVYELNQIDKDRKENTSSLLIRILKFLLVCFILTQILKWMMYV